MGCFCFRLGWRKFHHCLQHILKTVHFSCNFGGIFVSLHFIIVITCSVDRVVHYFLLFLKKKFNLGLELQYLRTQHPCFLQMLAKIKCYKVCCKTL